MMTDTAQEASTELRKDPRTMATLHLILFVLAIIAWAIAAFYGRPEPFILDRLSLLAIGLILFALSTIV